jgi:glycosyltransferase involved in cell wall biosynthesis
VSDEFIFTGIVPYEEVSKYISASDICVVPKRQLKSGYSPLKLYEYMACGKPVVASRVEGFTILEQNNAGILVEPENPENIANVIIKLLNDEKLREELGRNGREYVVKNHSWESVAKIVAEVCEDAVRNKK